MRAHRCLDVDIARHRVVGWQAPHGGPRSLVGGLVERCDVVDNPSEVDDPEGDQQEHRRHEGELGERLGALAAEKPQATGKHHLPPCTVKWALDATWMPPNAFRVDCMKVVASP